MVNKKQYPIQRSSYSGKIVNGRSVILTDEAHDYVKQSLLVQGMIKFIESLGYKVYNPQSNKLWIDQK